MRPPERSPRLEHGSVASGVTPRICLSMIVRNERAILERCLDAACPLLDAAVICDTGSSDDTPALAEAYFRARQIPARICHHRWQDFGANRTAAIDEAACLVAELGWSLDRTYWLFLDADHEIALTPAFERRSLTADAIVLRQHAGDLRYWNLRLARASLGWSAIGRTHERYSCASSPRYEQLATAWIHDHSDGASRVDKIARDIAWLTAQLAETPQDPRVLFYLAQSYRAAGDPLKALVLYRRRQALRAHAQEVSEAETWYSGLCIGQILAGTDHAELAAAALTQTAAADPARAEPLYELSKLALRQNRIEDAVAYASRGRRLPRPDAVMHFVHADVYEHGLDLQLAEAAIGTVHAETGFAASERVALSRLAPDTAIEAARRFAVCYVSPLEGVEYLGLQPAIEEGWRPCNPSLLRTADGYTVICRLVNYEQRRLYYRSLDGSGVYRTRNVLMHLDRAFNVLDQDEISLDTPPLRDAAVRGLEDCRLVATSQGLAFTCATVDRHPSGRVHQSICTLADDGRVVTHHPLVGGFDDTVQKNWLPFVTGDGPIRAIHSYDPLTILRFSSAHGQYDIEPPVACPVNGSRWRGSAGPIGWPGPTTSMSDRQLVLVHEAVRRQGSDGQWERVYLHRFVEYDASFHLTRISRPFVFAHKGVEFACGMAAAHGGRDLIVTLGIEDREAHLARIPFWRIDILLNTTRLE